MYVGNILLKSIHAYNSQKKKKNTHTLNSLGIAFIMFVLHGRQGVRYCQESVPAGSITAFFVYAAYNYVSFPLETPDVPVL